MAKSKSISALTDGDLKKQIFKFAIPVFISSIFSELYGITNSVIVGNYIDLKALSAVSACTWICNIFNFTFYGLGMGAGILVARYYGANDRENLKKSLDSSLVFALVGGIGLTVLSELGLPLLMRASNIGPDIYDAAKQYLRVYLIGNTAVLMSQMSFYILRSFGDTKHQLYYSIVSSIVNIVLGVIFVRVFKMNVVGTAIATIISQFTMDILALQLLFNYDGIDLDIHNINFDFEVVKDICRLGIPAGFQNMLIALSSMAVQSYINKFPNEVISGIGVAEKISGWGQMTSCAVAAATMSLVAQNEGAKRYDRVQLAIKESMRISTIFTLVSIALLVLTAPFTVSLFNDNQDVIRYGTNMIRYSSFGLYFVNWSHIYNAACRGAGNVKVPMMVAIIGQVICKYLFVSIGIKMFNDVHVFYFGTAVGYSMAGILAAIYFHTSKWTKQNHLK